tara:strand:+ start:243 stop:434 length:192 start_codon:yes stop_codon:yes gene_type:complete
MKLSHQAMGAIMMALQNSILEQSDIVPVLEEFDFDVTDANDLVVKNPPQARTLEEVEEKFKDA